MIKQVVKRSGEIEDYDRTKIANAIKKAFDAAETERSQAEKVANIEVITCIVEDLIEDLMAGRHHKSIPAIEEIQDLVETALVEAKETRVAKAYILYRAQHEAMRMSKNSCWISTARWTVI